MKHNVLDKFSKTGRLRNRLEEVIRNVETRDVSRMDGADLIGRHVVANLQGLPRRSDDENRLLFDAQKSRAIMYQESSGATALEAAEALADARAVLKGFSGSRTELGSLVDPAWAILIDLTKIGSRRTAWSCFQVLFDAIEASTTHDELRPRIVRLFIEMTREILVNRADPKILDVLLEVCDWTRKFVPDEFPELVRLIPSILESSLDELSTGPAIRAYLYARHLCVGIEPATVRRLVERLISGGCAGTEARSVYQEFLAGDPSRRDELEDSLERLAYVNPDPELPHDPDLGALNTLLATPYFNRAWIWRNRALLYRRRRDAVGAVACLAQAMNISGDPPEIMGLLAPVIADMGFVSAAHQFTRFLPTETRERFGLNVLDRIVAVPGSERGMVQLCRALTKDAQRSDLCLEFRPIVHRRIAEFHFAHGDLDEAQESFSEMLRAEPSDEIAAVRLAEIAFRRGENHKATRFLEAKFGHRVIPLVEHLRSRMAEQEGRFQEACECNQRALDEMASAQSAGREAKLKSLATLNDRIVSMLGRPMTDCALLAFLEMETHVPPHEDLRRLSPVLERRSIELSMKLGDVKSARAHIKSLIASRPTETGIFVTGIRASLKAGRLDEAREYLDRAIAAGHGGTVELPFLSGLIAVQDGEIETAQSLFQEAMDRVPTAEARLALASLEIENGHEGRAIDILGGLRDVEGGTNEVRRRVYELLGRLLERSGRLEEALQAYLASVDESDAWTESRRRAGILSVQFSVDDQGEITDRESLCRGLDLLEGFNDPDSVTHEALARAALEPSPRKSAAVLRTALRRTAGQHWLRLQLRLLPTLFRGGEFEEARQTVDAVLDESELDPELERQFRRCLADLRRRIALETLATATSMDAKVVKKTTRELKSAEEVYPSRVFDTIIRLLGRVAKSGSVRMRLDTTGTPAPLILASVIAGCRWDADGSLMDKVKDLVTSGSSERDRIIASLLCALDDDAGAVGLLTAIDRLEATEYSMPFARLDVLRSAAAKAVRHDDRRALEQLLSKAPNKLDDVRLYRRFLDIIDSPDIDDTASVMGILAELDRVTSKGELTNAENISEKLGGLRTRITELKETPSPAWASARLRTAGKRTRASSTESLAFWKDNCDTLGGEALHNMALMRLAIAHEDEAVGGSGVNLWKAAHVTWAQLVQDDAFWDSLTASLTESAGDQVEDAVQDVRRSVPYWLLKAQLIEAKKCLFGGSLGRAIQHGKLVASSPLLPLSSVDRVQDDLFSALSGELERQVQNGRYTDALESIDHVIVADPQNPTGRREMARVAGMALSQTFTVIDALTSAPDDSMLEDTCQMLARVLATAERPIRELADRDDLDAQLAVEVSVGLRGLAFIEFHKEKNTESAGEYADRAIEILDRVGQDSMRLRRFRSEVGLQLVEAKIRAGRTPVGESPVCELEDPLNQALAEVNRLITLDPDNIEVISQKARLLIACHRDDEAQAVARELFVSAQRKAEPSTVRAAVELMHQIHSERERFRFESKMILVGQMVQQRNWRAALDLFRETTVGRENEHDHLVKHVEILIGLRKVDKARAFLVQLADCADAGDEVEFLSARLACLEHMSAAGGDLLSAFELYERGRFESSLTIATEILDADDRDFAAHWLAARCLVRTSEPELAQEHDRTACKISTAERISWVDTMCRNSEEN